MLHLERRSVRGAVSALALLAAAGALSYSLYRSASVLGEERGRLNGLLREQRNARALRSSSGRIDEIWESVVLAHGVSETWETELADAVSRVESAAREAGVGLGGISPGRRGEASPQQVMKLTVDMEATETELVRFLGIASRPPGRFGVEHLHIAPGTGAKVKCEAELCRLSLVLNGGADGGP